MRQGGNRSRMAACWSGRSRAAAVSAANQHRASNATDEVEKYAKVIKAANIKPAQKRLITRGDRARSNGGRCARSPTRGAIMALGCGEGSEPLVIFSQTQTRHARNICPRLARLLMILARPPAPNTLLVTLCSLKIRQHRQDHLDIRRPRRDHQMTITHFGVQMLAAQSLILTSTTRAACERQRPRCQFAVPALPRWVGSPSEPGKRADGNRHVVEDDGGLRTVSVPIQPLYFLSWGLKAPARRRQHTANSRQSTAKLG